MIEQGVRLTLIGLGTAFGLLVALILLIALMGSIVSINSRRLSRRGGSALEQPASDSRDVALAAVVAVSALLERDGGADAAGGAAG